MATADMSDYERRAWAALLAEADKQHHSSHRFGDWTRGLRRRAGAVVQQLPGAGAALQVTDAALAKTMAGLQTVLVERGLNSVAPAGILAVFAEQGATVACYDDIRGLDLQVCDNTLPRRKDRYIALAATEGAASSLVVTGGVVAAVASGGATAAVAVSAIAADVTTVLAGMGRIVAVVAAHYGYDVREPDEQLFASGVFAYAVAGTAAEKAAALGSLSRLTQQLMRTAVRRQLRQRQLVAVTQRVFAALGFLLTRSKLAQAVPVLGAALNGGLNARIAQQTFDRAQQVYRLRFLTEKYGLDATRWAPPVQPGQSVHVPLVDEVLDAELASEPGEE